MTSDPKRRPFIVVSALDRNGYRTPRFVTTIELLRGSSAAGKDGAISTVLEVEIKVRLTFEEVKQSNKQAKNRNRQTVSPRV